MDSVEARLKTLMVASLAGNVAAYRQLLESVADRLRSYFARRAGTDCADLEDLVQETLIAIHRRRASYDQALPFTPWLHAIARYKLIDYLRQQNLRKHVQFNTEGEIAAADDLEAFLAAVDVERLLEELPEKHRQSIKLTRIDGYSIAEAAVMTGRSQSSVKISVHRGIKRLIARVQGSHDHD